MTVATGTTCTKQAVRDLYEMLMMKRPAFSSMDNAFIETFLRPLGVETDEYGNVYKRIGKDPIIAWSSHTDTVHRNQGYQLLTKNDKGIIKVHADEETNCLGADDTAGVWIMRELIKAERPGLYIFHRAEECGGKGGSWIVKNTPELVKGVQCMVALDRKDNDSVITFQAGGRCCSDEFGRSLAAQMIAGGTPVYRLDQGGTFTDSASYTDLLAECTNLSVGYKWQHTRAEELDMPHLILVREALINMDVTDLIIKRKPGEKESQYQYNQETTYNYGSHYRNRAANDELKQSIGSPDYCPPTYTNGYWVDNKWISATYMEWRNRRTYLIAQQKRSANSSVGEERNRLVKDTVKRGAYTRKLFRTLRGVVSEYTLEDIVRDYPALLSRMFEDWGFDAAYLFEEVESRKEDKPVSTDKDDNTSVRSTLN